MALFAPSRLVTSTVDTALLVFTPKVLGPPAPPYCPRVLFEPHQRNLRTRVVTNDDVVLRLKDHPTPKNVFLVSARTVNIENITCFMNMDISARLSLSELVRCLRSLGDDTSGFGMCINRIHKNTLSIVNLRLNTDDFHAVNFDVVGSVE